MPETEDGRSIGVLLVGSLAPWQRDETDMRKHRIGELWAGLGKLRSRLPQCMVDQAVLPEAPGDFALALAVGLFRSTAALARLAHSPVVALPSFSLNPSVSELVKWATIDVMRATLGEAAAASFLQRVPVARKSFLFVSGNVAWASVDLTLQRAGATTVEHDHGAHVDSGVSVVDTESSLRLVWTTTDARLAAIPADRVLVAGMPVRMRLPPRSRRARNILLLTNYVHRDLSPGQRTAQRLLQAEILDVARLLVKRGHADLRFRWRPHPADLDIEVQLAMRTVRDLELSRGESLETDAEWSDVIISTTSTTVVEGLFAGVPIFVQVLPDTWTDPPAAALSSNRTFFEAEQGARLVDEWLTAYATTPSLGLEPEGAARRGLFGPAGEPTPMDLYFGRSGRWGPKMV